MVCVGRMITLADRSMGKDGGKSTEDCWRSERSGGQVLLHAVWCQSIKGNL